MTEETTDRTIDLRPGLVATAVILIPVIGLSIWGWLQLPDDVQLPVHWGTSGEADRYGGKLEALGLLPAVMLGVSVLLAVLPRVLPRRENLASSSRAYLASWIGALLFMGGVHAVSVVNAVGGDIPVVRVVIAGVGALFLLLGNYLPKTRGNWAVGVRTPWTLENEHAWRRTHRLSGRLFAGVGVVLLVGAFVLPVAALFPVVLAGIVLVGVVPTAYSWWVWRGEHAASASGGGD